jgi:hypothetical protein
MSAGAYVIGLLAVLAVAMSAAAVGRSGRLWLLPDWSGPPAVLVNAVVAMSFVVVLGEVLGTFGLFRRWPLAIVAVVCGAGALLWSRGRRPAGVERLRRPVSTPTAAGIIAAVCVALLVAEAIVALGTTAHTGIEFVDATTYHLPWAAHFAVTHHTNTLLHMTPGNGQVFYGVNDELVHGMGIALLGRDSLTLLLGPLAIAFAALAAWCLGSAYGRGAVAVCAISPIAGILGAYDSDALNDWASIWPFLAAVAVLVLAQRRPEPPGLGAVAVAGLGLGLAAGTKLDLLVPVGALAIAVVVITRQRRAVVAATLVGTALVTGGYWFARNLVTVGSPLPSLHLPGLTHVPMSRVDQLGFSVAHYLDQPSVLRHWFVPGLHAVFGPVWPGLLALAVAGFVAAMWRGNDPLVRLLGVIALVGLAAYVVTPTTAFGPPGRPVLFPENLRYAWPELLLALILLTVSRVGQRFPALLSVAFLGLLASILTERTAWIDSVDLDTIVITVAVALAVTRLLLLPQVRRVARPLGAVAAVAALIGAYPAQQYYLHSRYQTHELGERGYYAYMQHVTGGRIGVVQLPIYPLLGQTYSNRVVYVGQLLPNHAFEDFTSCLAFKHAIVAARLDYVAVRPAKQGQQVAANAWLAADPAASRIFHNWAASVFQIQPGFGTGPCPS